MGRPWARSGAVAGQDVTEQPPAFAIELRQPQGLDWKIVRRTGVEPYAGQQQGYLDVLHAGRLLHEVLARERVAAQGQAMPQRRRDGVGIGVEIVGLACLWQVLRHPRLPGDEVRQASPLPVRRVLDVQGRDHALADVEPGRLERRGYGCRRVAEISYRRPAEI